jgi:hypothetical protein
MVFVVWFVDVWEEGAEENIRPKKQQVRIIAQ